MPVPVVIKLTKSMVFETHAGMKLRVAVRGEDYYLVYEYRGLVETLCKFVSPGYVNTAFKLLYGQWGTRAGLVDISDYTVDELLNLDELPNVIEACREQTASEPGLVEEEKGQGPQGRVP